MGIEDPSRYKLVGSKRLDDLKKKYQEEDTAAHQAEIGEELTPPTDVEIKSARRYEPTAERNEIAAAHQEEIGDEIVPPTDVEIQSARKYEPVAAQNASTAGSLEHNRSGGEQITEAEWNRRQQEMAAKAGATAESPEHNRSGGEQITEAEWNRRQQEMAAKAGATAESPEHNRSGGGQITEAEWNQRRQEMAAMAGTAIAVENLDHNRSGGGQITEAEWNQRQQEMAGAAAAGAAENLDHNRSGGGQISSEEFNEHAQEIQRHQEMQQSLDELRASQQRLIEAKGRVGKVAKLVDKYFGRSKKTGNVWEEYHQISAEVAANEKAYRKSLGAYGQVFVDRKRKDLLESGLHPDSKDFKTGMLSFLHNEKVIKTGEVDEQGNEITRTIGEEYDQRMMEANQMMAENLQPRDKKIWQHMLDKYRAMPTWKKIGMSLALSGGIGLAAGAATGAGLAALGYGAFRVGRSALGIGAGMAGKSVMELYQKWNDKKTGKTAEDFQVRGQEKFLDKMQDATDDWDSVVDQGLLKGLDKRRAVMMQYNEHKRKQLRNQMIAAGVAGGASTVLGGMVIDSMNAPKVPSSWEGTKPKFNVTLDDKPRAKFVPDVGDDARFKPEDFGFSKEGPKVGVAAEAIPHKPEVVPAVENMDIGDRPFRKGDSILKVLAAEHGGNKAAALEQYKEFRKGAMQNLVENHKLTPAEANKYIEWRTTHLQYENNPVHKMGADQWGIDKSGNLVVNDFDKYVESGQWKGKGGMGAAEAAPQGKGSAAAVEQGGGKRPKVANAEDYRAKKGTRIDVQHDQADARIADANERIARAKADEAYWDDQLRSAKQEGSFARQDALAVEIDRLYDRYDKIGFRGSEYQAISNVNVRELLEKTMANRADAAAAEYWRGGQGVNLPHDGAYGYQEFTRQRELGKLIRDYVSRHAEDRGTILRGNVHQFFEILSRKEAA